MSRQTNGNRTKQPSGQTGRDFSRNKFTTKMQRKLVALFIIVLLAFAGLSVRLIRINREDGEQYKKQVLSQQQYTSKTIPYKRGEILDAKGTKLAVSEKVYDVVLDCKQMNYKKEYVEPTIQALGQYFDLDTDEIRAYARENPTSQYRVLAKRLPYDQVSPFWELMEDPEKGKNIKGVWFEESYKRVYPNNALACDVIGFTTKDGLTGTYGLEEYYNDVLSGVNGREYGYLNDDSNVEGTTKAAIDGYNIHSTIDATIQGIVEKYLKKYNEENKNVAREGNGAHQASCIVMDIDSGEVLAMGSYPGFDLNDTRNTEALIGSQLIDISGNSTDTAVNQAIIDQMDEETLLQNLNALWKNYCINSTFEPGSTMKPFIAAMGLESGKLAGNESFECTGIIQVADRNMRCHNYLSGAEGWLTIEESIERSCNVALIRMAQVIGPEVFLKYAEEFNFGLKTNIDLAGEARTASLVFNENTLGVTELATSSFGQGFNVTMIQMITGFCSLINGGYYYEPHMVNKITAADGSVVKNIEPRLLKQVISAETSEKIRQYCITVVEGENGTGKYARPYGYRIGGKTGTAETVSRQGTRNKKDYVVSFLGFAPAENPQIAIYVVLDRPNHEDQDLATRKANIIARNVLTEVLPYLNIFMTETVTEAEQKELDEMQLEIRQQLIESGSVSGNSVSGNGTAGSGNGTSGTAVGDGSSGSGNASNSSGSGGAAEDSGTGEEGTGSTADTEHNGGGGPIVDPATGQPVDPGSEEFDTPVSGILINPDTEEEKEPGEP